MTNRIKHTPGPWKIMQCLPRKQNTPGQTETVIVDSNNRNILNRDLLEEAANAQLIISAPILLKTCKLALALLDTIANKLGSVTQGTDCDTLSTRAALEAAIREAEQEANQ